MPGKNSADKNDAASLIDNQTIQQFADRSDKNVSRLTLYFALGGAVADIVSHTLSGIFGGNSQFPMLWGLWIPLCFITIPPIHYLCRRVQALETRLTELEQRSLNKNAA